MGYYSQSVQEERDIMSAQIDVRKYFQEIDAAPCPLRFPEENHARSQLVQEERDIISAQIDVGKYFQEIDAAPCPLRFPEENHAREGKNRG